MVGGGMVASGVVAGVVGQEPGGSGEGCAAQGKRLVNNHERGGIAYSAEWLFQNGNGKWRRQRTLRNATNRVRNLRVHAAVCG